MEDCMDRLQEQLKAEQEAKRIKEQEEKLNPPVIIIPQTQTEIKTEPELDLRTLNAKIEAESKAEGYKSFRERESALKDGEKELEAEALALGEQRTKFEAEQVERVRVANAKLEEAKKALDLYKTKVADADKKMEQAQKLSSESERIIKAQSESERLQAEKQLAYETNMEESLKVFSEIATYVSKQGYSVGRILKYDVGLISRLQGRGANLNTIAEIIGADIDRINELSQELQDKNSNPKLLEYLNSNTEWLDTSLKIEWQPPTVEELK
jgi:hypothetical protein